MPNDLGPSLVLIRSKLSPRKFGTGFIVEQNGVSTLVVTCRHLIVGERSVGGVENAKIGFTEQEIKLAAIGEDDVEDFAVLEVTPPLPGLPLPLTSTKIGDQIRFEGFSDAGTSYQRSQLTARIGKRFEWLSRTRELSMNVWQIDLDPTNQLQQGYSGSPVLNAESNAVIGMITNMNADGRLGIGYELENLNKLWSGAANLFLEEKVMILFGPEDKTAAEEFAQALRDPVGRPIGFHQWTGTALDTMMLSSCKALVMIWGESLSAAGNDLNLLLQRRLDSHKLVVPVATLNSPSRKVLETVLPQNSWCQHTGPGDLGRLVQAITGVNPALPPPPPVPKLSTPISTVITDIADRFREGLLTFVIGGGLSPETQIVLKLMSGLNLPHPYSYMPLDMAGSCFAFSQSIPQLDRQMVTCGPSPDLIALCQELCVVLREASKLPAKRTIRPRQPQLVITTNFDLTIEKCFLQAGIPFLRVVNDRSGKMLFTTNFTEEVALHTMGSPLDQIDMQNLPIDQTVVEDQLEDRAAGQSQNPIQALSLGDAKVVLYKLVGSADINRSTILTWEQIFSNLPLLRTGKTTPIAILKILRTTDAVLLGFCHLDHSFRVIQQLLPTTFGDTPRYFVQEQPHESATDPLRILEAKIWDGLKKQRETDAQIRTTTIEDDPIAFVSKLSSLLAEQTL